MPDKEGALETEVLSIRVKKGIKEDAERLGIDLKEMLEKYLESTVSAKKRKAEREERELNRLMSATTKRYADEVRKIERKTKRRYA